MSGASTAGFQAWEKEWEVDIEEMFATLKVSPLRNTYPLSPLWLVACHFVIYCSPLPTYAPNHPTSLLSLPSLPFSQLALPHLPITRFHGQVERDELRRLHEAVHKAQDKVLLPCPTLFVCNPCSSSLCPLAHNTPGMARADGALLMASKISCGHWIDTRLLTPVCSAQRR